MPKPKPQSQSLTPPIPYIRVETTIEGRPESLTADPKVFKSGKPGYFGQARWQIGESKYMVQLQVVKINGD